MGDEIFRDDHTFADDSSRVVLFAYRNESYPEGVYYRMQYYDTDTGETLLRYDNAYEDAEIGWHHRHAREERSGIEFADIRTHKNRFLDEVEAIHDERTRD
jgi:hypothetical protein